MFLGEVLGVRAGIKQCRIRQIFNKMRTRHYMYVLRKRINLFVHFKVITEARNDMQIVQEITDALHFPL